ncbi:DUF21 domain-containing protein At1g47330-like isoform X2 [Aristolochia californica]|uniref:DUF21 domain-containing protein At1g47330-like isoform X2 n=1 Tax=Aristolochia californica TaxID=171875 RepID=UPI0035DBA151
MANGADVPCCNTKFWLFVLVVVGLVAFAGLMAGLTLGLMSLGLVDLEVLIKSGRPQDRVHAAKIFPVVKNQHLLLCTLLIGNSMAMESLPIFLDKLVPPWAAILVSVTLILMFGEILPQAICSRYGMMVGAALAPLVRILLLLFFPVAYPISKAGKGGDLTHDETTIIAGALELTEKTAKDAMTPISKAFSLDLDGTLDVETLNSIMAKGHSRVPVYAGNAYNIIGLILVKNLLMIDPKDAVPLRKMTIRKIPRVPENMPLYDILNEFQKGQSHIAVVIKDSSDRKEALKKHKEVKFIETRLKRETHQAFPTMTTKEELDSLKNPAAVNQKIQIKSDLNDSQVAHMCDKDGDQQQWVKRFAGGHTTKNRHRRSECILDVENAPLPEFPPSEEVVGVITMEDVIEELLQEEILDETDEYINIHNRIKVNMQASERSNPKLISSESSQTIALAARRAMSSAPFT